MPTVEEIREKLRTRSVGIAGCGGLGSNAAVALARVGIGRLVLADYDKVEPSNLNRQYYFSGQTGMFKVNALRDNIHLIDEAVTVEPHIVSLDPANVVELFADCDIIIEAFDKDDAKHMIIETVIAEMPEKYIISGQGLAGFGKNESIATRQFDRLYIIGDGQEEVSEENPPLGPRVGVVSNMQANLALELLLKND